MKVFQGFKSFVEEANPGHSICTYDFDETLTVWANVDGLWEQIPNVPNIKQYVYPKVRTGHDIYIVTFRDPALANDPRFRIYEKIEHYIEEWGMQDDIKGVIYTKLHPKGDYIFKLCQQTNLPFVQHYDDDITNCKDVNNNKMLREVATRPEGNLATYLPYRGPRPPKDKAGVIVPGQVKSPPAN